MPKVFGDIFVYTYLNPPPGSSFSRHHFLITPVKLSRCFFSALAAGWLGAGGLSAVAAPLISELMSANTATLADEDGDFSDWLEIYNPDPAPVDLSGWHLTDNANQPTKWTFPAGVTLPSGGFLLVWASSKNRTADPARLHTNFALSADGEYLALVAPDGQTRVSEFAPAFPALEDDESYGPVFEGTSLFDLGAAAEILVPSDDALGTTWTARDFTPGAGWTTGATAVGFGMLMPGFFIEERRSSATIGHIDTAESVLNGVNALDHLTAIRPVVNFVGGGDDARFDNGMPTLHGGDQSDYALRATGTLIIPTSGVWTFHVNSDDGFRLRLNGQVVMQHPDPRGPADTFGTRTLAAGAYALELTFYEQGGGDEVELSAAAGSHTSFSASLFRLIGDTANGGLAILTSPGGGGTGTGSLVQTDLSGPMRNVNASAYVRVPFDVADPSVFDTLDLALGYNDGFVAYLNGVEVARRHAPAAPGFDAAATTARPTLASLQPEWLSLSSFRPSLVAGRNVLALHGLNVTAADDTFYLAPKLSGSRRSDVGLRYFREATPGGANTTEPSLGRVGAPQFSVERGYYSTPQQVTLTSSTPGATLRYTTNGAMPTATSGTVYSGPITIDKTTTLRAAAFLAGYQNNVVVAHTYLFLDDVIRQSTTPTEGARPSAEWPNPGNVNGQVINYGMDPDIVNSGNAQIGGVTAVKAALQALPAVNISTDLANLFNSSTGIYVNAGSRGRAWERAASLEIIGDAGTPAGHVGVGCGIRIRGGYSRSGDNPKHAFRLFFRKEYGAGKLNYPVYGEEGPEEFDAIDLQCSQNYSWSFEGGSSHNGLREIWSRDAQLDLGWVSTRGRFVHLYLNGVYWGLYQFQERAEASFGATHLGGSDEDYDVVKAAGPSGGYTTEATDGYFTAMPDGSDAAWKKLWNATRACYWINNDKNPANPSQTLVSTAEEKRAAYYKIQGLQADGRTPTGEPALLDVDNLIDYVMLLFYTRNTDSGISAFLGNSRPNNFYTLRNRLGALGFISIAHDAEHSLNAGGAGDRWGPWENPLTGTWNDINYSNPQFFHQDLSASAEYRQRFADRIYLHFFNDGGLTVAANQARLDRRAVEVESGIIAESARWGDSKTSPPRNANDWRSARTSTRNWFTGRHEQFLNEARARGFYPNVQPPVFNQHGGAVPAGFELALTNPNPGGGVIYYTLDGSDPRPLDTASTTTMLVPEFAPASYLVPSTGNGGSGLTIAQWTGKNAPPNTAQWTAGPLGYGYAPARSGATDYYPFINTDVRDALARPQGGVYGSLYVRLPFTVTAAQLPDIDSLRLRVRFEDAFIAYLNGQEVVRGNLDSSFTPSWDSYCPSLHDDSAAVAQQDFNLGAFASLLTTGENVLAFHVLNVNSTSSDLLFSPQVEYDTLLNPGTLGTPYTGPLALNGRVTVRTRVLGGAAWSALEEASFTAGLVPASAANLVVAEFSYAPVGPQSEAEAGYEGRDFEFLELQNISADNVDLTGAAFTAGITFAFAGDASAVVPPGGRVVLVSNPAAYTARYPDAPAPLGAWSGNLNNGGETLVLTAADGSVIKEFAYSPAAPWPAEADEGGSSLVLIDSAANPDHADAAHWRASHTPLGTPGADDGDPHPPLTGYAAWKLAHGGLPDDADPDGDGLDFLTEYALGGSPTAPDHDKLPIAALQSLAIAGQTADYLTFTFTHPTAATDLDYLVETTPDLTAATWTAEATTEVSRTDHDNGATTRVLRSLAPVADSPRLFIRLRFHLRP